ncbi:hypothetical protein [Algicola sagamiensis]|nr:hypothetical protein [Algicola sagamiensis]
MALSIFAMPVPFFAEKVMSDVIGNQQEESIEKHRQRCAFHMDVILIR